MHRSRLAMASLLLLASVSTASADDVSTGIDLHRFVPGVGPGALLGIDGAGRPAQRLSLTASLDHDHGVLTVQNQLTHDVVSHPVRSITAMDLAGDLAFGRFSVGIGLPVALGMTGDRLAGLGLGDESPLRAVVLGDLRLRVRAHLFTSPDGRINLAALVVGTFPLDGKDQFFATSAPTIEPRIIMGWTAGRFVRFVALTGFRIMPERQLYAVTYSHEWHVAVGADIHVPRWFAARFHLLLELESAQGIHTDSPVWVDTRAGLRFFATRWLSVDVGGGLAHWSGSGGYRLLTVVRLER